jgi:hypothetical protein
MDIQKEIDRLKFSWGDVWFIAAAVVLTFIILPVGLVMGFMAWASLSGRAEDRRYLERKLLEVRWDDRYPSGVRDNRAHELHVGAGRGHAPHRLALPDQRVGTCTGRRAASEA